MKPEVATVSLARGVFRGDRRARIETEREQLNAGEFPQDVDAECERTSISRMHLYSNIQLSPSLAQQFLFETFSCFKIQLHGHGQHGQPEARHLQFDNQIEYCNLKDIFELT